MIKSIINDCYKPITAYIGSKQVWQNFTPADLFANGEQGVWLDPSDLSTMYQDVNGTKPVTKDGDPVGLMLDKSQGIYGNRYTKSSNFTEGSSTSSNIQITGGNTFNNSLTGVISFPIPNITKGKLYRVTLNITHTSTPSIRVYLSDLAGSGSLEGLDHAELNNTKGGNTVFIRAKGDNFTIRVSLQSGETTLNYLEVVEVEGNSAYQKTASARPIYRTDGDLHWLQADGVDDFLDTSLVPWNGSSFFQSSAVAITGGQRFLGIFRFLREGGNPTTLTDNYLEEYTSNSTGAAQSRKTVYQRYPSAASVYADSLTALTWDTNLVSWNSNNTESFKTQVIPTQLSPINLGVMSLASGNATLSLFRGYKGDLMSGRMYGFIWVSDTVSDENRDGANNYLMNKSGVTL